MCINVKEEKKMFVSIHRSSTQYNQINRRECKENFHSFSDTKQTDNNDEVQKPI